MTARLISLCFDANDPLRLARFWAEALRWNVADEASGGIGLLPTDGTSFGIRFLPVPSRKSGQNRLHLHIAPPAGASQRAEVDRLVALGATSIDSGRGDVDWVVMADPDGNEFCVLRPV